MELEFEKQEVVEKSNEQKRVEYLFHCVFSSPQGKEALDYLEQTFLGQPCLPSHAVDGHAMAQLTAFRDGENNMIRRIKNLATKGME